MYIRVVARGYIWGKECDYILESKEGSQGNEGGIRHYEDQSDDNEHEPRNQAMEKESELWRNPGKGDPTSIGS